MKRSLVTGFSFFLIGLGVSSWLYAVPLVMSPNPEALKLWVNGFKNAHALALDRSKDVFDRIDAEVDFALTPPLRAPSGINCMLYGGLAFAAGMGGLGAARTTRALQ